MNQQDSRDALDFFLSEEEALEKDRKESLVNISENLSDLAREQEQLDRECQEGMKRDRDFWEQCRLRSIELNK